MSINISKFMVSNDMKSIDLDLTVNTSQVVTKITMWDNNTYKDPSQSKDLSGLIVGATNSESIQISASYADVSLFSGIYFVQIETSDSEAVIVATMNMTQYYITQAKLIANIDLSCLNCNANFQNALLFDLYLEATKNALMLGRFQDAIDNLKNLIITVDSSGCSSCSDIEPLVSTAGNIVSVGVIDCLLTQQNN